MTDGETQREGAPIDAVLHLWVLRHAKAASESPDGKDHSRPLTKRGRAQAEATRRFLDRRRADGAPVPRLVITSSATRAVQTSEAVLPGLSTEVMLEVERDLYEADADDVIDRLRRVEEDVGSVMVVGHNPTFSDLVQLLLSDRSKDAKRRVESFPTCALAHIAIAGNDWGGLRPASGVLEEFFVPEVSKSGA